MSLQTTLAADGEDPVTFTFTVTNDASEPREVTFRSGLDAEFAVLEEGELRWRASEGELFTQALRSERFEPGESAVYEEAWSPPEAGTYTVVASLETIEGDVEDRVEFVV